MYQLQNTSVCDMAVALINAKSKLACLWTIAAGLQVTLQTRQCVVQCSKPTMEKSEKKEEKGEEMWLAYFTARLREAV
jgi:hypothetical protein